MVQILKDVNRTYQTMNYYKKGSRGYSKVVEVLYKFIRHEASLPWGYVQGMNFIAAILWYHAEPDVAFCMFTKLFLPNSISESGSESSKCFEFIFRNF